jgi:hypothetical protein
MSMLVFLADTVWTCRKIPTLRRNTLPPVLANGVKWNKVSHGDTSRVWRLRIGVITLSLHTWTRFWGQGRNVLSLRAYWCFPHRSVSLFYDGVRETRSTNKLRLRPTVFDVLRVVWMLGLRIQEQDTTLQASRDVTSALLQFHKRILACWVETLSKRTLYLHFEWGLDAFGVQ